MPGEVSLQMSLEVAQALQGLEAVISKERTSDQVLGKLQTTSRLLGDTWAAGLKKVSAEQRPIIEGHRKMEDGLRRIAEANRLAASEAQKAASLANKAGADRELEVMRQKLQLRTALTRLIDQETAKQRVATEEQRRQIVNLNMAAGMIAQLPALTRQQVTALRDMSQETIRNRDAARGLGDAFTAMAAAGGVLSVLTGKLAQFKTAIADVKAEAQEAAGRSLSRDESRAQLLQVAEGETPQAEQRDYAKLLKRSDYLAQQYGLERTEADKLLYEARQLGFESSVEDIAAARPVTGDTRRVTGIAGALAKNFGLSGQESVNLAMVGAAKSPLELESTSLGFQRIAAQAKQIGSSPAEVMNYLTVLTGRMGNTEMAADRLAYLVGRIAGEGLGGEGIAGGVRKIQAMPLEEFEQELGKRVELQQTLGYLRDPDVQRELEEVGPELEAAQRGAFAPDSALERKKAIARQDPQLSSNYEARKAARRLEIAKDSIAARENRRRAALDRAEAKMIERGVQPMRRSLFRDTADWVTSWLTGEGVMEPEQAEETATVPQMLLDFYRNPLGRTRAPLPSGLELAPPGPPPVQSRPFTGGQAPIHQAPYQGMGGRANEDQQMREQTSVLKQIRDKLLSPAQQLGTLVRVEAGQWLQ